MTTKALAYHKALLANNWEEIPHHFVTSVMEHTGKENLLSYIDEVNQEIFKDNGF